MIHLGTYGFVPNYYRWYHHGESYISNPSVLNDHQEEAFGETVNFQSHNIFRSMVFDVAGPSYDGNVEEDQNPTTHHIYDLLKALKQEIWTENLHRHTQLLLLLAC